MELDLFYRFIACMLNWFHSRSKRAVKGTERWKKTQAVKKECHGCGTSCAALKTLFAWTIVLCIADSEFGHRDVQIHFRQD